MSLIPPGTQYAARINQVDFRISKAVKLPQGRRVQGIVDVYNMFNGSAVITQSNSFGTTWQRPTAILQARLVKFGVQLDFGVVNREDARARRERRWYREWCRLQATAGCTIPA